MLGTPPRAAYVSTHRTDAVALHRRPRPRDRARHRGYAPVIPLPSSRGARPTSSAGAVLLLPILLLVACASPRSADDAAPPTPPNGTTTPATIDTSQPVDVECRWAAEAVTHAYEEIPGVDPDLTSVDVYGPHGRCGPRPVLFWIHGGGWRQGDKSQRIATKQAFAAANGWVLVSVNYRLSTAGSGVIWPTHGRDVATAIGWTLDHAADFAIDPTRVAVMGHSSGGHLAAMVTVDPDLMADAGSDRNAIRCLVALDTEGYDLVAKVEDGGTADALVVSAFGDDPATWMTASPTLVLRSVGGPVADSLVVTRGSPTRRAVARAFAAEIERAGSFEEVIVASGYDHSEVSAAVGDPADEVVTPAVTAFLDRCLG
ncbi:MAG: alpha/beta hydrolase [Acidimicrobiales bacterium]